LVLLAALFLSNVLADAQRRRPIGEPTGFDDVVFAVCFSPDDRTLAIARGASEPAQRYGRIELWDVETGKLRHVIKGFDGPVRSISFSPDGKTLVSASSEFRSSRIQDKARSREGNVFGELKWWDAQTGELKNKLTLPGEGSFSLRATYSPDGKQLALNESFMQMSFLGVPSGIDISGPSNPRMDFPRYYGPTFIFSSALKLLDAQTGEAKLKVSTAQPQRAIFSPDGMLLAAASGNEIKIWNGQSGEELHRLKSFKGRPNAIAFSPDSQSLAVVITKYYRESAGRVIKEIGSSEVRVFDVHSWKATLKLGSLGMAYSIAFEPSGRVLLIGGLIHEQETALPGVKLWDLQSGKTATYSTGGDDFSDAVDFLAISLRSGLVAFRSGPDAVKIMDAETWKVRYTFDAKSAGEDNQRSVNRFLLSVNHVTALAFSRDGKTLLGEIEGDGIKLWDPRTGEVKKRLGNHEGSSSITVISANGESIVDAGDDSGLRLWDVRSENQKVISKGGSEAISALALSTDGGLIAGASDKELRLWNARTGESMRTLSGHQAPINSLVFSTDDRLLASADEQGTINLWDLTTGQIKKTFSTGGKVTALRFAPGGQILASAGEDRSVSLWDLRIGSLQAKVRKHEAPVNAIAFSPDGKLFASGSDDRSVVIWETASAKSKRTLKGQDLTVTSLAFSPDGNLLASGGGNAAVVLWDVRTGKLNRVLK